MDCDRYCPLPSKETWIMPQYPSHAGQRVFVHLYCSPCSFFVLDVRICDMISCVLMSLKAAMLYCWAPFTAAVQIFCIVHCSDLNTACFSTTELVDSGQSGYSAVCLAPFFFIHPPTSPSQHGDSLKLTRRTHGVTTSSYRNVRSNRFGFEKASDCWNSLILHLCTWAQWK